MKPWFKVQVKMRNDKRWICMTDLCAKVWIQCLLCARMSEDACSIPAPEEMAFELRRDDAAVAKAYSDLAKLGWIAEDESGWTVPKFAEVQGDERDRELARIRKARQREKSRNVTACHDESRVTEACHDESRPVTVCHALEEMRGKETEKREELPPNGGLSDSTEPDPKPALKLESKKSQKAPSDPNVRIVFGLWQVLFFHGDAKLTDERRTKIATRLGEYGVDDCCRALLGYRIDDWDERFGGGLRTHDLGVLFRNGSQLEKGLAMYKADEANALKYCPPHLAVKVALSWANLVKSGRIQEGLKVSPELWAVFSGEHREGYAPDMPEILVRVMRQQLDGDVSAPTPEESAIIARLRGSQNG